MANLALIANAGGDAYFARAANTLAGFLRRRTRAAIALSVITAAERLGVSLSECFKGASQNRTGFSKKGSRGQIALPTLATARVESRPQAKLKANQ